MAAKKKAAKAQKAAVKAQVQPLRAAAHRR